MTSTPWVWSHVRARFGRALRIAFLTTAVGGAALPAASAAFAVANGGFEAGLAGWKPLFTREPQTGQAESDRDQFHAGSGAAKITHPGQADWSFETNARLPVVPGDLIELNAWVKIDGPGDVTLAASTWGRTARSSAGRSGRALRVRRPPGTRYKPAS